MGRSDQADMQAAIETIAKQYGISLPDGNRWQWAADMYEETGGGFVPAGGYTPRELGSNPDEKRYTSGGEPYPAEDTKYSIS